MGQLQVTILATAMICCSTTVTQNAWGDHSNRLAMALEQAEVDLQTQVSAPFQPGSPEILSLSLAGKSVSEKFNQQVAAWKALDQYSFELQHIFDSREMENAKIVKVAQAFHELHRQLLFSGIATSLGLSVEMHKETVQRILRSTSVVSSLETVQPSIGILCTNFSKASQTLLLDLDDWQDTCLRQVDSKWRDSLNGYAVLLSRKRDLEKEIAAQAAGATTRQGDPAGELLKVETLIRNSEGWRKTYTSDQRTIALAFQSAHSHVQKTAHAILEWGIAHREITKAMRNHAASANTRLLEASANELAPSASE